LTDNLIPTTLTTIIRCPACYGKLTSTWLCEHCGQQYQCTLGIPDLRWPSPKDSEQTGLVVKDMLESFDQASFEELCQIRLARLASVPDLECHYQQYRLDHMERGARMVRMFQDRVAGHFNLSRRSLALDIGCGSGAAASELCQSFAWVVGLDWSLVNLILFRKSLIEHHISNVVLIQGSFFHLPLADDTFDYVTALNVIEHMLDVRQGFAEVSRVLRRGGIFCGDSRNRYDLLFPEPHVKLRFVGLLPRRWAEVYIQRRRGVSYSDTRLLSYWELKRTLAMHFRDYRIMYPQLGAYGASEHADQLLYFLETKLGPLSKLLLPFFTTMIAAGCK